MVIKPLPSFAMARFQPVSAVTEENEHAHVSADVSQGYMQIRVLQFLNFLYFGPTSKVHRPIHVRFTAEALREHKKGARPKQCRRVATRYDKLAANSLAFIRSGQVVAARQRVP